jgi:chitinase
VIGGRIESTLPPMQARSISILVLAACAADPSAAVDTDTEGAGTTGPTTTAPVSTSVDPATSATTTTASTSTASTTTTDADTTVDPTDATGTTDTTDTGGEACVDDHRVVAFVANWTTCPTAEQLAQYSEVVIAFAVSYQWTPDGVICDESCTISPVDGCSGTALDQLVADLHAADIEVLVSFGGASMGGLWEGTCGEMTRCWDHCVDQVDSVVAQLTDIVVDNDLDGVDIDYEYCLHDDPHIAFVEDLTTELRASFDAASPGQHRRVTHAPMDSELEAGDPYYELLGRVADDVDFIMPQYYNGGRDPFTPEGLESIHQHYTALVDDLFDGDASKVVFGFCIEPGCNPVATQPAALEVMQTVDGWYPGNGGAFFWAHPNETDAWFSAPLREYYDAEYCE